MIQCICNAAESYIIACREQKGISQMKKIFAILMAVCMLACMLCVAVIPASAGGYSISVCGIDNRGLERALGVYDDCAEAWNDAIYYATHLEETWNESERYDEFDRLIEDGSFVGVVVDVYMDWNADNSGSFGSGLGFKDGALYIPENAKIVLDLHGNALNRGNANGTALYIGAGADVSIDNGSIIGKIDADKNAKVSTYNLYVAGNAVSAARGALRYGSIFGEGSLAMVVSISALVASVASICVSIALYKKNAAPAKAAEKEDEE